MVLFFYFCCPSYFSKMDLDALTLNRIRKMNWISFQIRSNQIAAAGGLGADPDRGHLCAGNRQPLQHRPGAQEGTDKGLG